MKLTAAQTALLGHLIDEAMRDEAAIGRRWQLPNVAPFVRERAEAGQLLLVRDWTEDVVLSRAGEVMVIDTEDGRPPRPATEPERRFSLFRSIERYPELLPLLPHRPPEAVECPGCAGAGIPALRFTNATLRHLVCGCGGSGWIVPEGSSVVDE